jgi:eukaryotic-like serine/threonine-protein kinase
MRAGKYAQAAEEYQKILDNPGIVLVDPLGAVARVQLGRALKKAGEIGKAKAAYGDFFQLWKDADQDVPLLQTAKAEFAKL